MSQTFTKSVWFSIPLGFSLSTQAKIIRLSRALHKSDYSITRTDPWGPFGQKLRLTRTLSLRMSMIRNFESSIFTQSGEIGTIALKLQSCLKKSYASHWNKHLFQTFSRKNDFLIGRFNIGFYMCLYLWIDSKYEMCMRFLMCFIFFIITFSRSPTY